MKVNIKIMLIAVLVVGFFGLLYAFLSSQPVMVADSRLRVEEPPLQSPSLSLENNTLTEIDIEPAIATNTDLSMEQNSLSSVVAETNIPVVPEQLIEQVDVVHSTISPETVVVLDREPETDVVPVEEDLNPLVNERSTTDVSVIADSDDFINLNLVETKPIEMILLEGDELILDDVNEGLNKFKSVVEANSTEVAVELSAASDNSLDEEQAEPMISAIAIPDVDQELMAGTDKVSLEYQATMDKLLNVKQQMREADAENERLKVKFSTVVNQNRELAILIRDIDVQIKTLTSAN